MSHLQLLTLLLGMQLGILYAPLLQESMDFIALYSALQVGGVDCSLTFFGLPDTSGTEIQRLSFESLEILGRT